jgi:hypothetical protein
MARDGSTMLCSGTKKAGATGLFCLVMKIDEQYLSLAAALSL